MGFLNWATLFCYVIYIITRRHILGSYVVVLFLLLLLCVCVFLFLFLFFF